jgi:nicotinamidase-related amidase
MRHTRIGWAHLNLVEEGGSPLSTALILIGVQRNLLQGESPVPGAQPLRRRLELLLERARAVGAVIVHVQHDGPAGAPDEPGRPGWELVLPVRAGERVLRTTVPDAFEADPKLAPWLREQDVEELVLAGLRSEHDIAATIRGALDAQFRVVLAAGAHGTYPAGGRSAEEVAAEVENELVEAGAQIGPAEGLSFD